MKAVDAHPQRELIINAIMAGEKLTEISARLNPHLSCATLSRYRAAFIAPALRGMVANSDKTKAIKLLASKGHVDINAPCAADISAATEVQGLVNGREGQSGIRAEIEKELRSRKARRNGWMAKAEEKEDFNALASLDGREYRDIELTARLAGVLQDTENTSGFRLRAVVMMPGPDRQPAAAVELEVKGR